MNYPFKYPEVYAELARQGIAKSKLADELRLTMAGLRYKQTHGDFNGEEMKKTASFLGKTVGALFGLEESA